MAVSKIQSSTYTPIYPTSLETGNLLVETVNSNTPPIIRIASFFTETGIGIIPAGTKSLSIANSGTSAGTLMGRVMPPGMVVSWTAPDNDVLSSIQFDAQGTTYSISEVR